MFSKKELEYLRGSLNVSKKYESKLNHLIRKKIDHFCETELPVLQQAEVIGGATSYLGKLTSCQSGLTPLNSGFEINII